MYLSNFFLGCFNVIDAQSMNLHLDKQGQFIISNLEY